MCGILGIVAPENSQTRVPLPQIEAMRDRMAARGPDDATIESKQNVVFAHRRLAIRDQTHGRQPIYSSNGRFLLTYNGEIYNDSELRSRLENLGHRFRGHGDTEVLAAAWQQWQESAVDRLRGMFAFGVYDFQEKKLTLVRDRVGVKPLFYTRLGDEIYFASSIAALTRNPLFSPEPNLSVIRHYLLTMRLTLDDQTVFDGIQTLRPAEMLTFRNGQCHSRFYWQPPLPDEIEIDDHPEVTFQETVDQIESTLRDAVAIRMTSDVPVGMMLSGGVDSNTLACLVRDETGDRFAARCGVGVDEQHGQASSDAKFARACADQNDLDFGEVAIGADNYLRGWQFLVEQYDTPVSTPTDVVINRIAKDLNSSVGVALGGEGADEACCGYQVPHWSGADFDLISGIQRLDQGSAAIAKSSLIQQYGAVAFHSAGEHYLACNGLIPRPAQRALLRPALWHQADADRGVERYYERLFDHLPPMRTVEKTAHVLLRTNLESLLGRLDSATMLASLESRVPYTDHLFVEQVFRTPHSFRIDVSPTESSPWRSSLDLANRGSLRSKRMIHSLAGRLMPAQLAKRPKCSFSTPVPSWLQDQWKSRIQERLSKSEFARMLFRPEALEELFLLPPQLSMWVWPVMNVVMWGDHCFR